MIIAIPLRGPQPNKIQSKIASRFFLKPPSGTLFVDPASKTNYVQK
jgi:hypothetical protein